MKHLPADLINSSKHFTFSGVIATEISNLDVLNTRTKNIDINLQSTNAVVGTEDTTIANDKETVIYTFSLDPGIYIMEFQVSWKKNPNGARYVGVALANSESWGEGNMQTSIVQPASTDTTRQLVVYFTHPRVKTDYKVTAIQTSGANLTCRLRMGKLKLTNQ